VLVKHISTPPARAAVSVIAVGLVTGAVFALRPVAPVLSLGVLYVFAVLPVAVLWGLRYAIPVSLASMLAFNFFFLPPVHTLALRDSENWVALTVYLVTAVVVSELAAASRRRAEETERLGRAAVEAEALRRSDQAKTAVLRAVSHDLRSPLTSIRAATEALQSGSLELAGAEREDLLETIRVEARRLERLVLNLLDLSRLEAGAARPRPELWTVDGLLARVLDALGPGSERVRFAATGLPPVRVDGTQLERVLVNVLENALKFSDGAPVDVLADSQGAEVFVRVLDRGPGLDADDRERIFEPFEHGVEGGTGLGLSIARGFAQANGGRLWAEPSAAGGSFVLALPAARERVEAVA
jgi:two-component system sensor histidine kinase KdpD